MKRYASRLMILAAMILPFFIAGCSDSENRHLAMLNQARVIIDMGLPEEHASAGILDRLRALFVPDAVAQTAPATFSRITVRITGPDIGLIERDFQPYNTITMDVKAGSLRRFEVIAYATSDYPAVSYRGTAAANLPAGATVSVPVLMTLHEAKLIVPDYNSDGGRVVVLDSVDSATWKSLQLYYYSIDTYIMIDPYDIDFDARGRMYVADNTYSIYRFDNLRYNEAAGGVVGELLTSAASGMVMSIAVDRNKNWLYAASSSNICGMSLNGTPPLDDSEIRYNYDLNSIGGTGISIRGIDVAPDGSLVILDLSSNSLYRYDPGYYNDQTTQYGAVLDSRPVYAISPADVRVWNNNIYVADTTNVDGSRIVELPLDFDTDTPLTGFGNPPSNEIYLEDTNHGEFYGPTHFLSGRVNELVVTDEGQMIGDGTFTYRRLVSFTDMTGAGWTQSNPGIGFEFYRNFY